jgi:hypothetical protein
MFMLFVFAALALLGLIFFIDGLLQGEVVRPLLGLSWAALWTFVAVWAVRPHWIPRVIAEPLGRFYGRHGLLLGSLAGGIAFAAIAYWYAVVPIEELLSGRRSWLARNLHDAFGEGAARALYVGICAFFSAACWRMFYGCVRTFRRPEP